MRPTRVIALLNRGGGRLQRGEIATAEVRAAFAAAGVEARVLVPSSAELPAAVRQALREKPDAVVAGGGDGTLATVASELLRAGGEVPLGVLPLGTFNRFAGDVGVPAALADAVEVVRGGARRRVDVAEVNGRLFLNTSTVGFGAAVVERRQDPRLRNRGGKAVATVAAALRTFPDFRTPLVRLRVGDEEVRRLTPLVIVSNNACSLRFPWFGTRGCLDGGALAVTVLARPGRAAIVRALFASLVRDLRHAPAFEHWEAPEVEIGVGPRPVPVFLDGELLYLRSPLTYRILPQALTVLAPPAAAAASAVA